MLLNKTPRLIQVAVAALAMTSSVAQTNASSQETPAPAPVTPADEPALTPAAPPVSRLHPNQIPDETCMATALCGLKKQLRWNKSTPWTPGFCRVIARKVLDASAKHDLPPALLLAVMVNESDLNERAFLPSVKDNTVYAKDSGLMGIRCLLDNAGKCTNGAVKGMPWKAVMDPLRNIDLGAGELARWRDGGGITKVEVRTRTKDGGIETKTKVVPCQHKTHAYWAHYNHGPRYIDTGSARHYPHRVAVLYHALAQAMNVDAPELRSMRITVADKGLRPRTPDRPVEKRYREICGYIRTAGGSCSGVAALPATVAPAGPQLK